jgi:voltage-gated potassium channel
MDPIRFRFRIYLSVFIVVMVTGTTGFVLVEGLSVPDALYFTIVTIATVGYGDIHPVTDIGKILAIFLIVMGVGTFLGVVANATETMLNQREKNSILKKLNIIVGVFYSEVGTQLLSTFSRSDPDMDTTGNRLDISLQWKKEDFITLKKSLKKQAFHIDAHRVDFSYLKQFLIDRRVFMVGLLENPILVENETFTETIRAVFHLAEELNAREDFSDLPETDIMHLAGDTNRAYGLLAGQWIDYMGYLKTYYPYLYSLAVRTNPFNKKASPIVEK